MNLPALHRSTTGLALGTLFCLTTTLAAQEFETFDSYAANSQVVGQGGWEEWGAGAGALVSSAQSLSSSNSIDIKGGTDLIKQYSGYNTGKWTYTAWQYIPKTMKGKTYFIILNKYTSPSGPYSWSVEVAFNAATGKVEADAGGTAGGATATIVYDKWIELRTVIDFDADWVQFYYDGVLMDDPLVANHATLGGGHQWTKGPFGNNTSGTKNIGALDLFANGATTVFYDQISLVRGDSWCEDFDTYQSGTQAVGQGGWEEWGAGAGALVSSSQSLTSGNSIDIKGGTDLIRQYSGYTTGKWEYTAWQYIPKTMKGKTYFIILNKYAAPSGPYSWSVEVAFNATTGNVEADAGGAAGGATAKIHYDHWVEIQVMIDLDADWVQVYYDGVLLDDPLVADHATLGGGHQWTKGPFGNNTSGTKNIGALDLFANGATSVYYDNICLRRAAKGVRRYDSRPGSNPQMFTVGDAVAPNPTFALAGRGPVSAVGFLGLSANSFPQGVPFLGTTLLIDPGPAVIAVVNTDATGGTSLSAPILAAYKGAKLFCQHIWIDPKTNVPVASNGLDFNIQ